MLRALASDWFGQIKSICPDIDLFAEIWFIDECTWYWMSLHQTDTFYCDSVSMSIMHTHTRTHRANNQNLKYTIHVQYIRYDTYIQLYNTYVTYVQHIQQIIPAGHSSFGLLLNSWNPWEHEIILFILDKLQPLQWPKIIIVSRNKSSTWLKSLFYWVAGIPL